MCAVPLLLEGRIQEKSGMESTIRTMQLAGFNSTTLGKHWLADFQHSEMLKLCSNDYKA